MLLVNYACAFHCAFSADDEVAIITGQSPIQHLSRLAYQDPGTGLLKWECEFPAYRALHEFMVVPRGTKSTLALLCPIRHPSSRV